jgi:hypothetical protein
LDTGQLGFGVCPELRYLRILHWLLALVLLLSLAEAVLAQDKPVLMLPAPAPMPALSAAPSQLALPAPPQRLALPAPQPVPSVAVPAVAPVPAAAPVVPPAPAAPSSIAPGGTIGRLRAAISGATRNLNPRNLGRQIQTNYRDHRFYATDHTQHSSIPSAIARSIKPLNMGANVRASLRNNLSPLSMVGMLVGPVTMELNRELSTDGRITPSKLLRAFEPGAIVGGIAGGFVGDALGAVGAGRHNGPGGAGDWLRGPPDHQLLVLPAGLQTGRSVASGKPSLSGALAESMRQVDPARDMGTLIGGSVGAVIGQAIIPIPIVGSVLGGMVGGVAGSMIGNWLGRHGPTGALNQGAVSWLQRTADGLDGKDKPKPAEAETAANAGSREKQETGPSERFDRDVLLSQPVTPRTTAPSAARRTQGTSSEVTPDASMLEELVAGH